MKRLQKIYYFFIITLLLTFVLQSCINDDLSGCLKEKRVYFSYRPASYASEADDVVKTGINPADIKQMDLYIFDENGLFVKKITDELPAMSFDYYMTIPDLKSGKYKFVAWGNLQDRYDISSKELIPGKTSIGELQVYLNGIVDKTVDESSVLLAPLFYATHKEQELEVNAMADQNFQLDMVQDTYTINLKIVGLDERTLKDNTYRLEIYDNNDKFKFDNDFVESDFFTYSSLCTQANDTLSSALAVMRLADNRKPILRVVNIQTGVSLVETDLVKLLLTPNDTKAKIDFSYQYEFNIKYILDTALAIVGIEINGWIWVPEGGVLEP
jgi:hypothetical protein